MLSFVSDPVPWGGGGRPVTGTLERKDCPPDPSGIFSPWFSPWRVPGPSHAPDKRWVIGTSVFASKALRVIRLKIITAIFKVHLFVLVSVHFYCSFLS